MAWTWVTSCTSGAEKRNGGTILGGGNIPSGTVFQWGAVRKSLDLLVDCQSAPLPGKVFQSENNGVDSTFRGAASGLAQIYLNPGDVHTLLSVPGIELKVGDAVRVENAIPTTYNGVHKVTALISSSGVATDRIYTVNATTAGTYRKLARNFDIMTRRQYIGMIIGNQIAGTADTTLVMGGAFGKMPYNPATGDETYSITGIDYFTGNITYGALRGSGNFYYNIMNSGVLLQEPVPTRAVPGVMVTMYGSLIASGHNYSAKNE